MKVNPLIILPLLVSGFTAVAQRKAPGTDTVLKGSTIEVLQSYKPKVKQSRKPEWKPQLPPVDTSLPSLSFEVPQQTLYYTYHSQPLRPLALGKSIADTTFPNYVKAGGGNISTAYLDAGIASLRGDNYETAIHLHHLSQKGNIKNQQTSLSGLEAEGTLYNQKNDAHIAVAAARNRYYYYGYNNTLYSYEKEDIRQTYTSVKLAGDLNNHKDTGTRFYYHPGFSASYYSARYNTSEISLGLNAPIAYKLNKNLDLYMGISGMLTSYKADTITTANNYVMGAPGVKVNTKRFKGHALAGFALGKDGSTYFLPDLVATYTIPDFDMRATLGWNATLRQNTYEQLTTENPYMLSNYQVIQSRRDEIYAHLEGNVGNHISWSGKVSWWNSFDMPTFLNDTGDQKEFYVLYQNVKALSFQLGARYQMAGKWSVGANADFYNFYSSTDQHVWHVPGTRIKADVTASPTPKLNLSAYAYVLGGINARDTGFNAVKLKTIADIGLNAEYTIVPRLSAFVQVNNLLNSKYQRWQGYEVYGFNIYGGLRLKF